MENQNQILEKIKKLIAHQKSAQEMGSVKEAEAFAKKVQNLLDKYNISLQDIPFEEVKKGMFEIRMQTTIPSVSDVLGSDLMHAISTWNWCKSFKVGSKHTIIVGLKENVEVCQSVYETVLPIFIQEGKKAYKLSFYNGGLDTFQREFIKGCCDGLYDKLKEERQDFEIKNISCSALIIRNDKAIGEFIEENHGKLRKIKKKVKRNEAYNSGYETGKNVEINKRIDV